MAKLKAPERKYRDTILVADLTEPINATLNGQYEEGSKDDFHDHYIGVNVNGANRFIGVGSESMSLSAIISAYGDETESWTGKPVTLTVATMKTGKYAGTLCLSVQIPTA